MSSSRGSFALPSNSSHLAIRSPSPDSHASVTTTDGPLGAVGWLRILCKATTGKLLPQFTDAQLRVLIVSFDEIPLSALFNTVFGGFPGLSLLYGARIQRPIEPGNTHIPFLSDYAESTGEETSIVKNRRLAPKSSTSSTSSSSSSTSSSSAPIAAATTTQALPPTTTRAGPAQSTSSSPSTRKQWVVFVDASTGHSEQQDDDDFSIVSTVRADQADEAKTTTMATALTIPERTRAAELAGASNSQGLPASVTNNCIMLKVCGKTFSLEQDHLVKKDGAGSSRSTGAFPNGSVVNVKARSLPVGFSCHPMAAPSTASWFLAKFVIVIQGAARLAAASCLWASLCEDNGQRCFTCSLAEVMSLRRGGTRSPRMVYVHRPPVAGDDVVWDFAVRLQGGGARLRTRPGRAGKRYITLAISTQVARYFGIEGDVVDGVWRAVVSIAVDTDVLVRVERDEQGTYKTLFCASIPQGKYAIVGDWRDAEQVLFPAACAFSRSATAACRTTRKTLRPPSLSC